MEHPLINNVSDLTVEELQARITELQKKSNMVRRMRNAHLQAQLDMALATFQNRMADIRRQEAEKIKAAGQDFSDRISIT